MSRCMRSVGEGSYEPQNVADMKKEESKGIFFFFMDIENEYYLNSIYPLLPLSCSILSSPARDNVSC